MCNTQAHARVCIENEKELLYNQVLKKIKIAVRILSRMAVIMTKYDEIMMKIWQKYDEIMSH